MEWARWGGVAFIWAIAIFTVLTAARSRRSAKRMELLYAKEAPPVGLVEFRLRTGDKLLVAPIEPHRSYVWFVPVPAPADQIEEIVLPVLPPWTSIVPRPQ